MYRNKFTPGRKSQNMNKIIGRQLLQDVSMYNCFCGQQDKWNPLQQGNVNPTMSTNMRVAQILGSTRLSGKVRFIHTSSFVELAPTILPLRNKF